VAGTLVAGTAVAGAAGAVGVALGAQANRLEIMKTASRAFISFFIFSSLLEKWFDQYVSLSNQYFYIFLLVIIDFLFGFTIQHYFLSCELGQTHIEN
jgi:hypothetical protein